MIATVMKDVLEGEGCQVSLAEDGPEALIILQRQPQEIGLVICDLNLPTFGALELHRRMRAQGTILKLLVCSGSLDDATLGKLRAGGLTNFLPKPFKLASLFTAVSELLGWGCQGRLAQ